MALKPYKPTSPGQRGLILIDRSHLYKGRPVKSLVEGKRSTGGRNAKGRVTSRHKGSGHKKLYRFIDFKRDNNINKVGEVQRIEYDPNRTSFIALVKNQTTGDLSYMLAPDGLTVGSSVHSGDNNEIRTGNTLLLKNIPIGVLIHNIELKIGKGGQLARSAGTSAQIAGRDGHYVLIRLPSGEIRKVHGECRATIGILSNGDHKNQYFSKAGRNRWKGRRPHVRGVAMNPIDHPHGGGEGKTSGGRHPVSPWGQCAKGKKTRHPKKASSKMIISKRKK